MRALIKSFAAATAVEAFLIAKAAAPSTDKTATVAAAATDPIIGIVGSIGANQGDMLDVVMLGPGEVRCGGNVNFGDPLTSDANGKAIKATPTAGQTKVIVGWAGAPGALDDIIPITVAPSVLATPA